MSLRALTFASLRTRFMVLAVGLTLIFSAIWGGWSWQQQRTLLEQQLQSEGEMLVSVMAIPIINALLYEELGIIEEGGLLDNFVTDIMSNKSLSPHYALVTDQQGRVLAHNRLAEYGEYLTDDVTLKLLQAEGFQVTRGLMGQEPILDFGVPLKISGKRWGALRVGVSLLPLQQRLKKLLFEIVAFALLFSAFALALFHVAGQRLSKPLVRLAQAMEKVPEQRPDLPSEQVRRDEIGQLQLSFIRLLDRLELSEAERDTSQRKLLENERLVTIGKLVSGVAHEVNNPLAGIQGALYNIEQKANSEILRYVNLVQSEVDRIGGIVGQLLDLSRAGDLEIDWVDSRQFLQSFCAFARMGLKNKLVYFDCEPREAPQVLLRMDQNKIHQLLINLLLNAADATGPSGKLKLSVSHQGDELIFWVDDNGPGVSTELKEQIFDLFFTTKEPGKGTGIGLPFCRSIAEKHGGSLRLSEKNTPGARFEIRLPLKDSDES